MVCGHVQVTVKWWFNLLEERQLTQTILDQTTHSIPIAEASGVIAAGDVETAKAGAAMLQQGGNAVDAAVAASFASFVTEVGFVNIGAGGMALVYQAGHPPVTYDFFSNTPSGSDHPTRSDFREIVVDYGAARQSFYIGRASVAVPGAVAGLCGMARDFGSLPLETLLAPAIRLAEKGFAVSAGQVYALQLLTDILTDTPESARLYAPQGWLLKAGDTFQNKALGQTLRHLAAAGPDHFYRGDIAAQIVQDQAAYGGLITADDLARYQVERRQPIEVVYRDYTILLPPLASLGGVLIAFSLKLLAEIDVARIVHQGQADYLRLLAEVMRLTNMARPDLRLNPSGVAEFLSDAYLTSYRQQLRQVLQTGSHLPEPIFPPGPSDTTHISVIDAQGNMVSLTTSAGEGAGFVVGETGVTLNNMLGEADLHPAGFHRYAPGTRLHTMMSPVIVLRNQQPVMALGSGGANRLRTAILQVLCNVCDLNLPLAAAVESPRVHFEVSEFQLEGGIAPEVAATLKQMGYQVNTWSDKHMYFGGAHAVGRVGSTLTAVGDARRGGVGQIAHASP